MGALVRTETGTGTKIGHRDPLIALARVCCCLFFFRFFHPRHTHTHTHSRHRFSRRRSWSSSGDARLPFVLVAGPLPRAVTCLATWFAACLPTRPWLWLAVCPCFWRKGLWAIIIGREGQERHWSAPRSACLGFACLLSLCLSLPQTRTHTHPASPTASSLRARISPRGPRDGLAPLVSHF